MLNSWLDHEEQQALEQILRFHGVEDEALTKHLAEFVNWVKADQRAKGRFVKGSEPPYLLVLLSSMGIYGKDALQKDKEVT